jgi:hypothetical protein
MKASNLWFKTAVTVHCSRAVKQEIHKNNIFFYNTRLQNVFLTDGKLLNIFLLGMSLGCHFVNCSFNMGSKWWTQFLSPTKICDRRPSPPTLRIGAKCQWWLLSLPRFLYLSAYVLGNEYRLWNRHEALQQLSLHFPQRWTVWIKIHLLCDCRSGVGRHQPLSHSTFFVKFCPSTFVFLTLSLPPSSSSSHACSYLTIHM